MCCGLYSQRLAVGAQAERGCGAEWWGFLGDPLCVAGLFVMDGAKWAPSRCGSEYISQPGLLEGEEKGGPSSSTCCSACFLLCCLG